MEYQSIFIACCILLAGAESPDQITISNPPSNQIGGPSNSFGASSTGSPVPQYGPPSRGNGGGRGNGQFGGFPSRPQEGNGNQFGHSSGQDESNLSREPANYDFNYNVQDDQFGVQFQHQENRQGDGTRGSYRVLLPDGRIQLVEYEADENGFRPRIRYEDAPAGANPGGFPRPTLGSNVKENGSTGYQFRK